MYKGSDIRLKSLRKGTRANVFIHLGNIWFPPRPTFLTDKVGFGIMKSSYFFCFTLLRPHLDYWAQERHWITGACPVQYRNDEGSEVSVRGGQNELRWRKEGSGGLIAEYKWGEWMKTETRLAPSYRSRGNKHTFKYMKFYLNTLQENTSIVKLVKKWNRLAREVMEILSRRYSQYWATCSSLFCFSREVGLHDHRRSNLNASVILVYCGYQLTHRLQSMYLILLRSILIHSN